MSNKVLVVLTDGFEEIEVITPIDILRRAGCDVTVAGLGKKELTGSHGINVVADVIFEQYRDTPDALILPGGPGAETLGKNEELKKVIAYLLEQKKTVAAICAAPAVVLARNGFLKGKNATSFPGYEKEMSAGGAIFSDKRVVTDGLIVTSRGAGTAMEFSLKLVEKLIDPETARKIAQQVLAL